MNYFYKKSRSIFFFCGGEGKGGLAGAGGSEFFLNKISKTYLKNIFGGRGEGAGV